MKATPLLNPIPQSKAEAIVLLGEIAYDIRMVEGRINENLRKIDRLLKAGSEAWHIYPFTSLSEQQAEREHNYALLQRLRERFNKVLISLKY